MAVSWAASTRLQTGRRAAGGTCTCSRSRQQLVLHRSHTHHPWWLWARSRRRHFCTDGSSRQDTAETPPPPTYQVTCAAFPSFLITSFPLEGRWILCGRAGSCNLMFNQKQITHWNVVWRNRLFLFQGFNCTTNASHISHTTKSHFFVCVCALQP